MCSHWVLFGRWNLLPNFTLNNLSFSPKRIVVAIPNCAEGAIEFLNQIPNMLINGGFEIDSSIACKRDKIAKNDKLQIKLNY